MAKKNSQMKVILKVLVPSKSLKGDYHEVEIYKNGEMKCNCIAGFYKVKECDHIKEVKKWLKNYVKSLPKLSKRV